MKATFFDEHWVDTQGNPAGGVSTGTGVCISWQNGPLGRGSERKEPNGAFVETVLAMVQSRLLFYETAGDGKFSCQENRDAIACIDQALIVLNARTQARESRGIEGTHTA